MWDLFFYFVEIAVEVSEIMYLFTDRPIPTFLGVIELEFQIFFKN